MNCSAVPVDGPTVRFDLTEVLGSPPGHRGNSPDHRRAIGELLARLYAPQGVRQKIMLTSSAPQWLVEQARELVGAAGRRPDREVCLLHPRPGETRVRAEDAADFLHRYGHEFSVAYFDAGDLAVTARDEIDRISAAARSEQVVIGWDLTGLDPKTRWPGAEGPPMDFAVLRSDAPAGPGHGCELFLAEPEQPGAADPETAVTPGELRAVMGRFATGVGMVSTWHEGEFFAAPVNSLTAVSLEPPLILVCFQHHSRTGRAVVNSGDWAVSILGQHQEHLSRRLAKSNPVDAGPDENRIDGVPVLSDAIGRIRCRTEQLITAGDHVVVIGRVLRAEHSAGDPLVFYAGGYHRLPQPD